MDVESQKFPGIEQVVRLLKLSEAKERRRLLKSIGKHHPDHFPYVFKESFCPEDIEFFTEKQLLELADHCDNTLLALSIYELPSEFQDYFLNVITSFRAKEIRYIIENFEKADIHRDIDKAKKHLIEIIHQYFF